MSTRKKSASTEAKNLRASDIADYGKAVFYGLADRWRKVLHQGEPLATWQHEEDDPSNSPDAQPIIFEFFWAPLPHGVPCLIADHGQMHPQLIERLGLANT